jgi:hypothetical protein
VPRTRQAAEGRAGQGAATHGATASGSAGVLRAGRAESPRAATLRAALAPRAAPWPRRKGRAGIGQAQASALTANRAEAAGGHATPGEPRTTRRAPWTRAGQAAPRPRAASRTPWPRARRGRDGAPRGVATATPAELRPRTRGTPAELQATGRRDGEEGTGEPGADREQAQASALAADRAEAAELGGTGSSAGARASKAHSRAGRAPRAAAAEPHAEPHQRRRGAGKKGRGFTLTASSAASSGRERLQARHRARGFGKKVKILGTRLGLIWTIWHGAARSWAIQPSGARESRVAVGEMAAGTHGGCADHTPAPGARAALRLGSDWAARRGAKAAGPRAPLGRGEGRPAGPRREGGEGEKKARLGRAQGNRPKREGKGFFLFIFPVLALIHH